MSAPIPSPAFDQAGQGSASSVAHVYVRGSHETPQGTARSSWTRSGRRFELKVTVPANTTAEAWVSSAGGDVHAPTRAIFDRTEGDRAIYSVPADEFTFRSRAGSAPTPVAG